MVLHDMGRTAGIGYCALRSDREKAPCGAMTDRPRMIEVDVTDKIAEGATR